MWKKHLDPYISVLDPVSSHVLALSYVKPGLQTSIHITVYLSTAGKDNDFMKDLANLQATIDNIVEKYPDSLLFVRGDANACFPARNQNKRDELFQYFVDENNFNSLPINHKSYHHFMNEGRPDSNIDVIMGCTVSSEGCSHLSSESLTKVICGKTNPLVDSSHDILVSTLKLPKQPLLDDTSGNVTAPRIHHSKHKVIWSEEGIIQYQHFLANALPSLQSDYCDVEDPEMASVLLKVTNHILTEAAMHTNKSVKLGQIPIPKKPFIPTDITAALKAKGEAFTHLNKVNSNTAATASEKEEAKTVQKSTKASHQNLIRKHNVSKEVKRDSDLLALLSKQPKDIFKAFRKTKSAKASKVKTLKVGDNTYTEDQVSDGFYESISQLKTLNEITATSFDQFAEDHRNIVEICKSGDKIPKISYTQAEALLRKIRPGVSDFFSITAAHYLNGGPLTIRHFQFLVNTLIENIELAAIEELNKVHAIILHKGHRKDKALGQSF